MSIINDLEKIAANTVRHYGGGEIHLVGGSKRAQAAASEMFAQFERVTAIAKHSALGAAVGVAAGALGQLETMAMPAGVGAAAGVINSLFRR